MAKENLVKKLRKGLGRKVMPYVLSGFLTLFGACSDNFVGPNPPNLEEPEEPITYMKPVAVLAANPTEGYVPLKVKFDASGSFCDSKCKIETYELDADNDENPDIISDQPEMEYTYNQTGTYQASLKVIDDKGQISNKALETIVVNEEEIITLGKIAFWSNRNVPEGGYNEEIYSGDIVMRDDDIELIDMTRLTTDPGQDLEPVWKYDGQKILFTSHRTGGTAVWEMDPDGKNQRDISSHLVERARQAHWGSNGKIVVAYRDLGDSEAGIGIIDPIEDFFTSLYAQPNVGGRPEWPKWSPDCSEIAFAREVNGNWEVYKMNSDGNNLTNLTNDPAIDGSPDWFPDGNYLLFKSYRFGSADLYLMDKNGVYVGRLTYDPGIETDPSFSADGSKIIFTHDIDMSNPQIYVMNADGTGEWVQLTTEGANRYPAWRPKIEDLNFN